MTNFWGSPNADDAVADQERLFLNAAEWERDELDPIIQQQMTRPTGTRVLPFGKQVDAYEFVYNAPDRGKQIADRYETFVGMTGGKRTPATFKRFVKDMHKLEKARRNRIEGVPEEDLEDAN